MLLRLRYEAKRRGLFTRAPAGSLRDYLSSPWPALNTSTAALPMLALDLETSGLNAKRDNVVSMGWVLLDGGRINLSSARHYLVKPNRPVPATAVVIHGIGDDQAATGKPLPEVLNLLLQDLKGRVVVGHHIGMDVEFVATAGTLRRVGVWRCPA